MTPEMIPQNGSRNHPGDTPSVRSLSTLRLTAQRRPGDVVPGVGPIPRTGQRLSGSGVAAKLFLGEAACVMSLDPVSALWSCASTSPSRAERAATPQLHRCELLTCTRRLALALPERFQIPPRGSWEVAPVQRLPYQCGDAWSSVRNPPFPVEAFDASVAA